MLVSEPFEIYKPDKFYKSYDIFHFDFFFPLWTLQGIITRKQGWINRRYVSQVNGRQEHANMRDYTTTTIQIVLKRERSALQL